MANIHARLLKCKKLPGLRFVICMFSMPLFVYIKKYELIFLLISVVIYFYVKMYEAEIVNI